jgi:hypothetical protein
MGSAACTLVGTVLPRAYTIYHTLTLEQQRWCFDKIYIPRHLDRRQDLLRLVIARRTSDGQGAAPLHSPGRIRAKFYGTVVCLSNPLWIKHNKLCWVLVLDATAGCVLNIRDELDICAVCRTAHLVFLNLVSSQNPEAHHSVCPELLSLNNGGERHFVVVFWFLHRPGPTSFCMAQWNFAVQQ